MDASQIRAHCAQGEVLDYEARLSLELGRSPALSSRGPLLGCIQSRAFAVKGLEAQMAVDCPTMHPHSFIRRLSPFEAARSALSIKPDMRDAIDWSEQMVSVARARDRASFMRIYDHFMPRVCMYLRGMGSTEVVAEELAQEALLRLWRQAERYDPSRGAVSTWLFRIARNLHLDRVRHEPRWVDVQSDFEILVDDTAAVHKPTEDYAEYAELRRCIMQLPALQARLIRMSYLESKSHGEIAGELSMPLGTVKSTLRRAFAKLQSAMGGTR